MSDLNDVQLDAADALAPLVRRHLSAELDGQRGRAEAAFLRHIGDVGHIGAAAGNGAASASSASTAARPPGDAQPFMRFRGWFLTLAGTALAASFAGLLVAPAIFRQPSGPAVTGTGPRAGGPTQPMTQLVQDRTWDGGTVVVDNEAGDPVPARRIVRERLERARWYDPAQKAWNEVTIPRQDVRLMEVDTY